MILGRKKSSEELRQLLELRRSNASGAVPSKRHQSRKKTKRQEIQDAQENG
jgi:hypothetical protein